MCLCVSSEHCWNHMMASHSEVFLLEGTTSKWQHITFVYLQQSKQQKKNISRVAWKLSFSLTEGDFATLFHAFSISWLCTAVAFAEPPTSCPFSYSAFVSSLQLLCAMVPIQLSLHTQPLSLHTHAEERYNLAQLDSEVFNSGLV